MEWNVCYVCICIYIYNITKLGQNKIPVKCVIVGYRKELSRDNFAGVPSCSIMFE